MLEQNAVVMMAEKQAALVALSLSFFDRLSDPPTPLRPLFF
jgi:hypothetical protein